MTSVRQPSGTAALPPALDRSVLEMLRVWQEDGQPDLVAELTAVFEADGHDRLVKLRHAVIARDVAAARRAAHSLRGMSGTIGALHLSELSAELEKSAPDAVTDARVRQIEREFRRVVDALRGA